MQNIDVNQLKEDIHALIFKTIASMYENLKKTHARIFQDSDLDNQNFQLLGFDIMIDQHLKPWLLEVNQNPSFNADTPFDYKLKSDVIRETLNLLNLNDSKVKKDFKSFSLIEKF